MNDFIIYGAALTISYWIAKMILAAIVGVALLCTALVIFVVSDVIKMLRIKKARRQRK